MKLERNAVMHEKMFVLPWVYVLGFFPLETELVNFQSQ